MTKREAQKACKMLEANGCRDTEIIRWQGGGWSVIATDNATGYRFRDDSLERVEERIANRAFYLAEATGTL